MDTVSEDNLSSLLSSTNQLINHVYWVKQTFALKPSKEHIATSINYSDIKERREDFLRELVNTISAWVYSKQKAVAILEERLSDTQGDIQNASAFLTTQAFTKFRPGLSQGQFGELLLFNFIQHFFRAVPLLRKQSITTSVGHERFGADAIHYRKERGSNILLLGESKCYKSDYKFKQAFSESLLSIKKTFTNIDNELQLYVYDDFIEPEVRSIAKAYKQGTLPNIHFELLCLIAYNETKRISGNDEDSIKASILRTIENRCESLDDEIYEAVNDRILKRINYVIFPIWNFDDLLELFQSRVGL